MRRATPATRLHCARLLAALSAADERAGSVEGKREGGQASRFGSFYRQSALGVGVGRRAFESCHAARYQDVK